MNGEQQEIFFDLLTKKAIYGLDETEQRELERIDPGSAGDELFSLEMTAAAISMIDLASEEAMPTALSAKISKSADKWVGESAWPPEYKEVEEKSSGGWFGWLGWGAAIAACAALAINVYWTQIQQPTQIVAAPSPTVAPRVLTPSELREEMVKSASGLIKADWAAGNVKELKDLSGDVVWSDAKQTGYMRLRGLPVNDKSKETYQLWIFDKTQDKATPIDGGTFDVAANGEVVIPIDAKLKAVEPGMFAITIEKPGGVVVSKREKIAALATVVPAKTG